MALYPILAASQEPHADLAPVASQPRPRAAPRLSLIHI